MESKKAIYRPLKFSGLKPTDWFLCKEAMNFFTFDLKQVVVLGLRVIYLSLHDVYFREKLLEIAEEIKHENLSFPDKSIKYKSFLDINPSRDMRYKDTLEVYGESTYTSPIPEGK